MHLFSGVLVQILVDLILISSVAILWLKLTRPQKDDPRLSRGLQLLQSKIAVLEDLSDEVDNQVQQITTLLEVKVKDVQAQINSANAMIEKIQENMQKSMEVAQIFQDRIPHAEIIERQNSLKYIRAARLAHQGMSAQEIAKTVDLGLGELDLIIKMNREQLQFSENDLPEWAKGENATSNIISSKMGSNEEIKASLDVKPLAREQDQIQVPEIKIETKKSVSFEKPILEMPESNLIPKVETLTKTNAKVLAKTTTGKSVEVQRVVFRQINSTTI